MPKKDLDLDSELPNSVQPHERLCILHDILDSIRASPRKKVHHRGRRHDPSMANRGKEKLSEALAACEAGNTVHEIESAPRSYST